MSVYKTCPLCRANLDPGEKCDCTKKTAASAANTDNGKAGNGIPSQIPASHDNRKLWRFQDE